MRNLNFTKRLFVILVICMIVYAGKQVLSAETLKGSQAPVIKEKINVARITPKELRTRLFKGEDVMIVDVRSLEEYNAQHIVIAQSIPLNEIEARFKEFPRDRDIIFY